MTISSEQIFEGNFIIDEFLGKTNIRYDEDFNAIMEALTKIEGLTNEEGEVVYNSTVSTNTQQPEWGHNASLYGSGKHHWTYRSFYVKNAPSKILAIWMVVVEFIMHYNNKSK